MSLTKPLPDMAQSPVAFFVTCGAKEVFTEVKGAGGKMVKQGTGRGKFEHYVKPKNEGEKGENVDVTDWFEEGIFVLDNNLYSVTGYNNDDKYKIQSNEVRGKDDDGNIIEAILKVLGYPTEKGKKSFLLGKGIYSEIKEKVCTKDIGGRYTRCIYFMNRKGDLCHLQLHGNAMASWFDSIEKKSADIHKRWIVLKDWKPESNGSNDYMVPQFSYAEEIKADDLAKAGQHDTVVQAYLDKRMAQQSKMNSGSETHDEEHGNEGGSEKKNETPEAYNTQAWRKFRETADQPTLGSLSIQQLFGLKEQCESKNDINGDLYACVGQAVYDYQQILKTGSWKAEVNTAGNTFEAMSLNELKAALKAIQEGRPDSKFKISVEAAIECKEAEAGAQPDPEASVGGAREFDPDDEIPF